jgi:phosphoenolpyruvate synthase/pyruvate phosphate dikinase
MKTVYKFNEASELKEKKVSDFGGKGNNLVKLYEFNVPNGLLVPSNTLKLFFQQKLQSKTTLLNDIDENINDNKEEEDKNNNNKTIEDFIKEKLLLIIEENEIDNIRLILKELRETIERQDILNKEFLTELSIKLKELIKEKKETYFAVRSSGTEEDTEEFSFAGQHDTYCKYLKFY